VNGQPLLQKYRTLCLENQELITQLSSSIDTIRRDDSLNVEIKSKLIVENVKQMVQPFLNSLEEQQFTTVLDLLGSNLSRIPHRIAAELFETSKDTRVIIDEHLNKIANILKNYYIPKFLRLN
jgi:NADH:ubiquinone oxidoreductase subunit C